MEIITDDVKYIAKLAKLKFSEDEVEVFAKEFESILEQFKTLEKLNLDNIDMERKKESVLRKDVCKKYDIDDLYRNSKNMRETFIEVPKIIE